jgi:hypothetical protein
LRGTDTTDRAPVPDRGPWLRGCTP